MVDLKAKPYSLSDEDICWVEDTIASMTEEEKVGQLFVNMLSSTNPMQIRKTVERYHPGALRYHNMAPEAEWDFINAYQQSSKVPMLIACNCEGGGNGGVEGGTPVAMGAATAASNDPELAYLTATVGAKECGAVGSNWNFAPIVDLLYNWRNSIVQLRAFCKDPDATIRYAKAFLRGTRENGIVTCCKHFPGDGTEECDQHLMMGVNELSADEWMETYGKVYRALIEDGVMTIMAGHIAQPAWQRRIAGRNLDDHEILPATLCPELITGLLKEKLGFNGLVVTDASHMIGMFGAMPRSRQVPQAIAAGCDMFLFFNDPEEDFGFMLQGYRDGIITEERMQDALHRILGVKAAAGLHKKQRAGTLMPPKAGLSAVGSSENKAIASRCADRFITLVKDTQHALPITPATHPRLRVFYLDGDGTVIAGKLQKGNGAAQKAQIFDSLRGLGFVVTDGDAFAAKGSVKEFADSTDAVLVFLCQSGFAQMNTMRTKWTLPVDQPWYVRERPTVFISFDRANSLIDLTMSRTYINCYQYSPMVLEQLLDKLMGKSEFHGTPDENVWCGRWDTRL
jgi:beta-N-acetylhexosaminidase